MPRFITIPKPEKLRGVFAILEGGKRTPLEITISWNQLHNLGIWSSPKWMKSTDTTQAHRECIRLLDEAEEGTWVAVPDDYFGVYQSIALSAPLQLEESQFKGLTQQVLAARTQLLAPVISPPTQPPEPEAETSTDTQPADEPASKEE